MGKLDALRADVDEAIRKFEDCQDAYATDMFGFLGKEQIYTEKLQQVSDLPPLLHIASDQNLSECIFHLGPRRQGL